MFKTRNFKFSARWGVVAPHARALPARPPARPRHRAHAWSTHPHMRALAHMGGTKQMPSRRK
jgi:hypothetical protein